MSSGKMITIHLSGIRGDVKAEELTQRIGGLRTAKCEHLNFQEMTDNEMRDRYYTAQLYHGETVGIFMCQACAKEQLKQ